MEATKNMKLLRRELLNKRRRLIFNNDGGDNKSVCVFPTADDFLLHQYYGIDEATHGHMSVEPEEFLRHRTYPLLGTNVDTISYCTSRSNAHLRHFSLDYLPGNCKNTLLERLIFKGTNPLKVMIDFCRKNNLEIFWAMRMNDTHDASRSDRIIDNSFKTEHPEYLMGTTKNKPLYGGWSALNYGIAEVREQVFLYIEDTCQNYDIDGIDLDFFRHPVLFKQTSEGLPVSNEECIMLTDLMKRIRKMADETGKKRGKPILISVRVPDSVDYCKTIGIDLDCWLREDLTDILVVTSYLRMNSWEYSVKLGHKYGVKVYPSLDESRVKDMRQDDHLMENMVRERLNLLYVGGRMNTRNSVESYRGQAMNIWNSGADGVYLFDLFDLQYNELCTELGDYEMLKCLDKVYFASDRGVGKVAGGAYPHESFINISTLNPQAPVPLSVKQHKIELDIGEDVKTVEENGFKSDIRLKIQTDGVVKSKNLLVLFNDCLLDECIVSNFNFEYVLESDRVKQGVNSIVISLASDDLKLNLLDLKMKVIYKKTNVT